jgi:hypothetical protein
VQKDQAGIQASHLFFLFNIFYYVSVRARYVKVLKKFVRQ